MGTEVEEIVVGRIHGLLHMLCGVAGVAHVCLTGHFECRLLIVSWPMWVD